MEPVIWHIRSQWLSATDSKVTLSIMIKIFVFHACKKTQSYSSKSVSSSHTLSQNREYQSMPKTFVFHAYDCAKFKHSIQLSLWAPLKYFHSKRLEYQIMIKTFVFHACAKFNHIQISLSVPLTLSKYAKVLFFIHMIAKKFKHSTQLSLWAPLT